MENSIALRIERLEERIDAACRRSGRKRRDVKLMGVSKFQPREAVEEAWKAGLRLFGENRVQEAVEKFSGFWESHKHEDESHLDEPHLNAGLHLIGSLQRNKAKSAVSFFDCIQSVDRDSLIDALGVLTIGRENPLMIMLEYHTAEDTKAGFRSMDELCRAAEKILFFPGLMPAGLMTMAPFTGDEAAIRSSFRKLAAAASELEKRFGGEENSGNWSCLSMGMTSDFETAIEEGSTLIRIGTAIFGERLL